MKKTYEAPSIEKVAFMYRDQVVVASTGINQHTCLLHYSHEDGVGKACQANYYYENSTAPN